MHNKTATIIGHFLSGAASVITLYLLIHSSSGYRGISDFVITAFLFVWILSPYLAMSYVLYRHSRLSQARVFVDCVIIILLSIAGPYMIVNALFYSKDPQAPIAILFVPVFQLIIVGLLLIYYAVKDNP